MLTPTFQVLVEGPASKTEAVVPRQSVPLSQCSLTRIVLDQLPRGAGSAALKKRWNEQEVESKWSNSNYAQNQAKTMKRRQLSDFERFKVMRMRKQVS